MLVLAFLHQFYGGFKWLKHIFFSGECRTHIGKRSEGFDVLFDIFRWRGREKKVAKVRLKP
jgi:hypothetical protein